MTLSIIYNAHPQSDLVTLLTYINDFTKGIGEQNVEVDPDKCLSMLRGLKQDFPHKDGFDAANVFKKTAHFMCYFIAEQPISSPFSAENIGELATISNHQNAIVALQIAIESLQGASVGANTERECTLGNKIALSKHSYGDIICAIRSVTPNLHFQLVTVLLEQMAYKVNPNCQYNLVI